MIKKYFTLLLLIGLSANLKAATIYVNSSATGSNNGTSWTNAFTNLQSAINASVATDNIWVAAGTYFPTQLRIAGNLRSASFFINKNIKIYGGFIGTETTLSQRDFTANQTILSGDFNQNDIDTNGNGINDFNDTENAYTILFFNNVNNTALLDGFKITGANADGTATYSLGASTVQTNTGGAIYNLSSAVVLNNLKLTNNGSDFGSGVYNSASTSQLNNSEVSYNYAAYGAGSYNTLNSVFTINNTDFFFNRGTGGTVGLVNNSVVKANNCEFQYNSMAYGGAFYQNNASSILLNVKISNNTATSSGGGMYCVDYAIATLYNTLINNNSAVNNGGGIYNNDNSYSKMTNATITGNSAGLRGGGIYNEVSPDNLDTRIYNSIIWANTAATSGPSIYYTFYAEENVHIRNSIIAGSGGSAAWNASFGDNDGGNFAQDPLFVSAASENYALQAASVGLNSAYNQFLSLPNGSNAWTASDADVNGNSRLQGSGVDMGAFEAGGTLGIAPQTQKNFSYNNPIQKGGDLTIHIATAFSGYNIAIFNLQGKLVKTQRFDDQSILNINTSELNSGIYFCRISSANQEITETLKVVIE